MRAPLAIRRGCSKLQLASDAGRQLAGFGGWAGGAELVRSVVVLMGRGREQTMVLGGKTPSDSDWKVLLLTLLVEAGRPTRMCEASAKAQAQGLSL